MSWEELHALREHNASLYRGKTRTAHPKCGPWFTDVDADPERGVRCGMCGMDGRVQDHCHVTGLFRGWLCYSCNGQEARDAGVVWDAWRVSAPGLSGKRWFYRHPSQLLYGRKITEEELLTGDVLGLLKWISTLTERWHLERERAA